MIKLINKTTGGYMWVAEDRKEEYEAAGHALAALPEAAPKKAPKKRAVKK